MALAILATFNAVLAAAPLVALPFGKDVGGSSSPYAGVTQSDALGGATVVTGKEDEENDKDSGEGTDRSTLGYSGAGLRGQSLAVG